MKKIVFIYFGYFVLCRLLTSLDLSQYTAPLAYCSDSIHCFFIDYFCNSAFWGMVCSDASQGYSFPIGTDVRVSVSWCMGFLCLVYGCYEMYGFARYQMYGCILFLWHLPCSCVWGTKRKIVYLLLVLSVASRHVIKILFENAMFVISCRFTIFFKRDKLEQ